MKLKEYLAQLRAVIKENPGALEFDVVTSGDDEGNYFNPVHYSPAVGYFNGSDASFDSEPEEAKPNAVCLN